MPLQWPNILYDCIKLLIQFNCYLCFVFATLWYQCILYMIGLLSMQSFGSYPMLWLKRAGKLNVFASNTQPNHTASHIDMQRRASLKHCIICRYLVSHINLGIQPNRTKIPRGAQLKSLGCTN